ncbi:hypothetical protein BURCENBC7_AP0800 [Burkholderia cenocepacia BC7]|nr:hypothetical protein BURCENBC7_AP0800 [Burkholderia cenocepacia BC7]
MKKGRAPTHPSRADRQSSRSFDFFRLWFTLITKGNERS